MGGWDEIWDRTKDLMELRGKIADPMAVNFNLFSCVGPAHIDADVEKALPSPPYPCWGIRIAYCLRLPNQYERGLDLPAFPLLASFSSLYVRAP